MNTNFEVSENFISLEGEAKYTNRPTIYTRLARCNFKCSFFNNPTKERAKSGYAPLPFDPQDYDKLEDLPLIDIGCDSQYSVNPEFKHLWRKLSIDQLIDELENLLPHGKWIHPHTGLPVIYSLTGGEPTLHWKKLPLIFLHSRMKECRHILVETNAAVPSKQPFYDGIAQWLSEDSRRQWTWSISPKLSVSGETKDEALKPEIFRDMYALVERYPQQCDIYLKYVCDDVDSDFAEVEEFNRAYFEVLPEGAEVHTWIMPVACTDDQQNKIARAVATRCIRDGYGFSYRTQNALWGNGVGT